MAKLLKCPFHEKVDKCTNCSVKNGAVWNYDKKCSNDQSVEYVDLETYKPPVEGLATFKGNPMTPLQIKAERKVRNNNHFINEVLPVLPKDDQLYHSKKMNLKLGADGTR